MTKTNTAWITAPSGYDTTTVGRYTVIVWTGSEATDLDNGHQVCEAYIPTTDRDYPDGRMIVGRHRLDTRDRTVARGIAMQIALEAIADFEQYAR